MAKLAIIREARVTGEAETPKDVRGEAFAVSVVKGVPQALDGVSPVITVRIEDAERDAARLLRAAEQLLPVHRQAPGIVALDEEDEVSGVILRADLEEAVMQMQRREYAALAEGLGLRADYTPPAGDLLAPFVYWQCPQCEHVRVPPVGHEDDPPPECPLHDAPVRMVRRIHGGE